MEMTLKTNQPGHWYKCRNKSCTLRVPLPDKIFIGTSDDEAFEAECKCGHVNVFRYSEAQDVCSKAEVDRYFGIKSSDRPKFVASWKE